MDTTATSNTNLYQSTDWRRLTGRYVEIRLGKQLYRHGIVDMVMPDGSGLWLAADNAHSRQYLDKHDGYLLLADDFCSTAST